MVIFAGETLRKRPTIPDKTSRHCPDPDNLLVFVSVRNLIDDLPAVPRPVRQTGPSHVNERLPSMKKLPVLAVAAAALAVAGFAAPAQARVFVGIDIPLVAAAPPVAPPPVAEYAPGPAPGYGYVWIPGYRSWNGYSYVWVRGRWGYPPRAGAVWVGPGWVNWNGGWRWRRGYWR